MGSSPNISQIDLENTNFEVSITKICDILNNFTLKDGEKFRKRLKVRSEDIDSVREEIREIK